MKKFFATLVLSVGILFSGCGSENPAPPTTTAPKPVEQKTEPVQAPVQPQKVTNLGMTFEQFKSSYNATLNGFGLSSLSIYDTKFVAGTEKNTYRYEFTPNLYMLASVDINTGIMIDVSLLTTPQTDDDLVAMLMTYGVVMMTLNPELSEEQRGALMKELYLTPDRLPSLKDANRKAIRGNVKYVTSFINEYALFMLGAEAKDV